LGSKNENTEGILWGSSPIASKISPRNRIIGLSGSFLYSEARMAFISRIYGPWSCPLRCKRSEKCFFFENDETTVIIWKQWKDLLDGICIKNMILGFSIENYRCNGCFETPILIASEIPIFSSFEGIRNHFGVSRGRI
jgi:hypothetical protein